MILIKAHDLRRKKTWRLSTPNFLSILSNLVPNRINSVDYTQGYFVSKCTLCKLQILSVVSCWLKQIHVTWVWIQVDVFLKISEVTFSYSGLNFSSVNSKLALTWRLALPEIRSQNSIRKQSFWAECTLYVNSSVTQISIKSHFTSRLDQLFLFFFTVCDWSRPIRSTTNRGFDSHVFQRIKQFAYFYLDFSTETPCHIFLRFDRPLLLLVWFYNTQIGHALASKTLFFYSFFDTRGTELRLVSFSKLAPPPLFYLLH